MKSNGGRSPHKHNQFLPLWGRTRANEDKIMSLNFFFISFFLLNLQLEDSFLPHDGTIYYNHPHPLGGVAAW